MKGKLLRIFGVLASVIGSPRLLFAPPLDFSFDQAAGLSGRVVTPNGDGANDAIIFHFYNPMDSAVTLEIFDLAGASVSNLAGLAGDQKLVWDGRDGRGSPVSAGIYIYQVRAEGKTFSGTIVVAR
ncbi:MAG: gliding motility-associated C-terminal domain-containing protein [Elusimicrobiota bacterium]